MKSREEILKQARAWRIPFGKYQGSSLLDIANRDAAYLRLLLTHDYALTYHTWLRKAIIRTLAAMGIAWKPEANHAN